MPELKLIPLSEVIDHEEINQLEAMLQELGASESEVIDDEADVEESLGEDQLTDFLDKLEAHDIACDIYLPQEFEGTLIVNDRMYGSATFLVEALEDIRDELDIDGESELDADDEEELEVIDEQLHNAWISFSRAAQACVESGLPLHVIQ